MRRVITFLIFVCSIAPLTYISAQNDCACWQPRDTSFHYVPFHYCTSECSIEYAPYYRNDDGATKGIFLPFNFCFWGTNADTVFINTNGNITLGINGKQFTTYSPDTFPQVSTIVPAMIAPFWGDVDLTNGLGGSDVVLYKITAHYMIVQWDSVGCYDTSITNTPRNSFQLIISDGTDPIIPKGNNVEFCYRKMQWTTGGASGGDSNDFGGDPATVGANFGDGVKFVQIGLFDTSGNGYQGQFPPAPHYDGVSWLDNKSFLFNLCSGSIAPLLSGVSPCDTFRFCIGDSLLIPIYFYSPVQGDSVWSNVVPPLPSGVSIFSNTPGPVDSIVIKVVANSFNVGYHVINLYGYDNQHPPDTTFTSFVIEVDTIPKVGIKAVKDTICPGDTSVLTANGGRFYMWSNGATTASTKVAPNYTQYYSVDISNGGCQKDTLIQVFVLPSANAGITVKPDTICPRDSVLLIASGSRPYRWSTGQTQDSIWVTPAITSVYTLRATNGICSDSAKVSVFVTTPGTTRISGSDSICPFAVDTLTASGGTSYNWSTGATTSTIIINPDSTQTYTVISTVACGIDTVKKIVKIIPLPIPKISGRLSVCESQGDTITASGGTTYIWSDGSTGNQYIYKNINADSTLSVEVFNGKCHVDTTIQIVILPLPNPAITVKPDTICPRDSVLLIASGGGPYKWSTGQTKDSIWVNPAITTTYYLSATKGFCTDSVKTSVFVTTPGTTKLTIAYDSICPFAFDTLTASGGSVYKWSTGATTSSIVVNPGTNQTYTLISTVTCAIDTLKQTVKIIPLPIPKITGRLDVCKTQGDTITASGGTSYIWSNGTTGNQYIFKNIDADSTISVELFNGKCHVDTAIKITIKAPPVDSISPPVLACAGSHILLQAFGSGSGPLTFLWKPGNKTSDTVSVLDTGKVTYTVYISNGCVSSKTTTVIPDAPVLNACCDKVIISGDDTVINSYGKGIVKYQWIDSNNVVCLNPPHCDTVKVSPTVTTTYTVIGTDSLGCQVERIVTITVDIPCFDFYVPNVFSPNGDGRNDEFYVTTKNLDKYQILIYDRWGQEVYKSTNPMQGWNGNTEIGGKAPTGVYYYIITSTCEGTTYNKNGFLQLIR